MIDKTQFHPPVPEGTKMTIVTTVKTMEDYFDAVGIDRQERTPSENYDDETVIGDDGWSTWKTLCVGALMMAIGAVLFVVLREAASLVR